MEIHGWKRDRFKLFLLLSTDVKLFFVLEIFNILLNGTKTTKGTLSVVPAIINRAVQMVFGNLATDCYLFHCCRIFDSFMHSHVLLWLGIYDELILCPGKVSLKISSSMSGLPFSTFCRAHISYSEPPIAKHTFVYLSTLLYSMDDIESPAGTVWSTTLSLDHDPHFWTS